MKSFVILQILFFSISTIYSQNVENKYIVREKTIEPDGGYHLELIPGNRADFELKKKFGTSIDDRDLFSSYPYDKKIEILKELLTFQGDTTKSSKSYKIKYSDLRRIEVKPFTIQIEALYTFSRLLLIGYPYFLPQLTNKKNKANYNSKQRIIDEVYDIYRKWLEDAIKSDFNHLTSPMSGTKYQWQGQEVITSKWFIDFHYEREKEYEKKK